MPRRSSASQFLLDRSRPCALPDAGRGSKHEDYTYNFYLDETFQGRAPGHIVETDIKAEPVGDEALRVTQSLEWCGPVEWAAPAGRIAARETRTLTIGSKPNMLIIDLELRLASADWDSRSVQRVTPISTCASPIR